MAAAAPVRVDRGPNPLDQLRQRAIADGRPEAIEAAFGLTGTLEELERAGHIRIERARNGLGFNTIPLTDTGQEVIDAILD